MPSDSADDGYSPHVALDGALLVLSGILGSIAGALLGPGYALPGLFAGLAGGVMLVSRERQRFRDLNHNNYSNE